MVKEYRMYNNLKSTSFQVILGLFILDIWTVFSLAKSKNGVIGILIWLLISSILKAFAYFYVGKLLVKVDDESLMVVMPDRTQKMKFSDIYKIEISLSWSGYQYYIFYKVGGKKSVTVFPDDIKNYRELLDYVCEKSGVEVRSEFDLKELKSAPLIKKIVLGTFYILAFIAIFVFPVYVIITQLHK